MQVLTDIRSNFDFENGMHEILLSGAVGSAKSLLMAHIVVTHCLFNNNAFALIARKALPDLKQTLFSMIIDHLTIDGLVHGEDYAINTTNASIWFRNGSRIIGKSWSDKKYKKFRSMNLSMAAIEELTENNEEDKEAYDEIRSRIGRAVGVKENLLISASNPDSPRHWAYKYFISEPKPNRHVYYSKTVDNPFIPHWYYNQLKEAYDPKMARRMLEGEWLDIAEEGIYYNYDATRNRKSGKYQIDTKLPIAISFDFNIGEGKPFSVAIMQYDGKIYHLFDEVVIQGSRTISALEEIAGRGYLDHANVIKIYGDATGKARSTNALHSDYDIIEKFISNYRPNIRYEMCVPRANPPIRERHNIMNSLFLNAKGDVRFYLYENCKVADEGFRLTAFKKGGQFVEDDSKHYQHITTSVGYMCAYNENLRGLKQIGSSAR